MKNLKKTCCKKYLDGLPLCALALIAVGCAKSTGQSKAVAAMYQGAAAGYVTNKVVDSRKNPVNGAVILLNNAVLYAANIKGTTDAGGFYKIKITTGIWKVSASGSIVGFIQLTNSSNGQSLDNVRLVLAPVGVLMDSSSGSVLHLGRNP